MDLNYLYFRQQVSLLRSDNAACKRSSTAHRRLATVLPIGRSSTNREGTAQSPAETASSQSSILKRA